MKDALVLSSALVQLDADELATLVAGRFDREPVGMRDALSLALELLRPESVERALRLCTATQLARLSEIAHGATPSVAEGQELLRLGLVGVQHEHVTGLDAVANVLASLLPSAPETPAPHTSGESAPSTPHDFPDPDWASRAFVAAQQSVLILRTLTHEPGPASRSGELLATVRARLAEQLRTTSEDVRDLLRGMRLAGLIHALELPSPRGQDRRIAAVPTSGAWSVLPHPLRWLELAVGILASAPPHLRNAWRQQPDLRRLAEREIPETYPLLSPEDERSIAEFLRIAERFGITAGGVLVPSVTLLLAEDIRAAVRTASAAFPEPVAGVYVQPDLSIVAPGPLVPSDGLRLLDVADISGPGLAVTLQLSEQSLTRALERGWTVEQISEFLERLSLTGTPQPLSFLLGDLRERHGSLIVCSCRNGSFLTAVTGTDAAMMTALIVDSRVRGLGLVREHAESRTAYSRVSPEHVHAMLVDARYPATLALTPESPSGPSSPGEPELRAAYERITVALCRSASAVSPDDWPVRLAQSLVRETQQGSADAHSRQVSQLVQLAVRRKTPLRVEIDVRGARHTLSLVPLALSNGRLRALDQQADVERTLPVEAILTVEALG